MNKITQWPALIALASSLVLTGCNLTAEDRDRIDSAEDNLQKVALDPKILQPSNDETISGVVDVIVDVDDSVEYDKVTLQVGTVVVGTLTEAPYTFSLDTYFLADQEKVTLLAKAYMVDGNVLRSDVVSVAIDDTAAGSLQITSPAQGETFPKNADVTVAWTALASASSYEYQIDDGTIVETQETSISVTFDEIAKHTVRIRAKNADGERGVWTESTQFATGLFAFAFDIKKYGYSWERDDQPIDFLISDDDFIVLASGADGYSDGSGDSYNANVAKINQSGELAWHKTYASYLSPSALSLSPKGFLVNAKKQNWGTGVVFELDANGNVTWDYQVAGVPRIGSEPYSNEFINGVVALPDEQVLVSRMTFEYEQYKNDPSDSYWRSRLTNKELAFEVIDQNTDEIQRIVVEQPVGGEYTTVNQFMLTDDDIIAAGKFVSESGGNDGSSDSYQYISSTGSGAVLFHLDKESGELNNAKTRTGGGLANGQINDLGRDSSGNIYVAYSDWSRAGATVFNPASSYNFFANATGVAYGVMGSHESTNEVLIGGESTTSYLPTQMVRLSSGYETDRFNLYDYSSDLKIKSIKYDERFGFVVLATDKGNVNFNNGAYTVLFNISEYNDYISPTGLINP